MEIITYVLEGALEHRDSLGTGSVITPGEVQRMSAGTGVRHSEYNASSTEPVHLLQIWIQPARAGIAPEYEQKTFPVSERRGRLRLIAAPDGRDGAVTIHQDAAVYATTLARDEVVGHAPAAGRLGWLQVARGALLLNGERLAQGDGAAIENEHALTIEALENAEALLFDLPAAG
jgi:redox-sensitive bicupin YhaK (pirin superfamily)